MEIKKEFTALFHSLEKQRDQIKLELHLAGKEAKDLWHKTEKQWDSFVDKLGVINDDSKETSKELIHATRVIGDELKATYKRITDRLDVE
jgi:hypothetical protein